MGWRTFRKTVDRGTLSFVSYTARRCFTTPSFRRDILSVSLRRSSCVPECDMCTMLEGLSIPILVSYVEINHLPNYISHTSSAHPLTQVRIVPLSIAKLHFLLSCNRQRCSRYSSLAFIHVFRPLHDEPESHPEREGSALIGAYPSRKARFTSACPGSTEHFFQSPLELIVRPTLRLSLSCLSEFLTSHNSVTGRSRSGRFSQVLVSLRCNRLLHFSTRPSFNFSN